MRNPDSLPKKKRYQQGFSVIYLVAAVVLASTVFDDYNVFLVSAVMLTVYCLLKFLVGVYVGRNDNL
ncbi:hypothetical protein [Halobacillus sp. A5]|uniref:hypothetical protein n=1 Tax=Halobacillus sp. A5 TaxID=2880263 RepID=UPI0020A68BD7|nr:hypothetical protein [Halobacillus sp. A5]MCP3029487.1 hypothetical protein [Halobacillus sp. A5]